MCFAALTHVFHLITVIERSDLSIIQIKWSHFARTGQRLFCSIIRVAQSLSVRTIKHYCLTQAVVRYLLILSFTTAISTTYANTLYWPAAPRQRLFSLFILFKQPSRGNLRPSSFSGSGWVLTGAVSLRFPATPRSRFLLFGTRSWPVRVVTAYLITEFVDDMWAMNATINDAIVVVCAF
jgi:hypothetical protein